MIPFVGFIISLVLPRKNEKLISRISFLTVGTHLVFSIYFISSWLMSGMKDIDFKEFSIFRSGNSDVVSFFGI